MRTENVKPKVPVIQAIPQNLHQFLSEVHELILARDESATIPSDDLIQCEFAYGGLIDDGGHAYSFSYFPGRQNTLTWNFSLTTSDIADIAAGRKKVLNLWRCQNQSCSSHFDSPDQTCFDCDYADDDADPKAKYLQSLRSSPSREEWVRGYLKKFPDAHPLEIIGDYNGDDECTSRWPGFSLDEMRVLISRVK
jgi:hypothetical protein